MPQKSSSVLFHVVVLISYTYKCRSQSNGCVVFSTMSSMPLFQACDAIGEQGHASTVTNDSSLLDQTGSPTHLTANALGLVADYGELVCFLFLQETR